MAQETKPAKGKKRVKVTRVVDGHPVEEWIEVDDVAIAWPERSTLAVLDKDLLRVDAPLKLTGRAEYRRGVALDGDPALAQDRQQALPVLFLERQAEVVHAPVAALARRLPVVPQGRREQVDDRGFVETDAGERLFAAPVLVSALDLHERGVSKYQVPPDADEELLARLRVSYLPLAVFKKSIGSDIVVCEGQTCRVFL